jgi:hypothetical protein
MAAQNHQNRHLFFVSGASNVDEAIGQGMPSAAARTGRSTKPSVLLDA